MKQTIVYGQHNKYDLYKGQHKKGGISKFVNKGWTQRSKKDKCPFIEVRLIFQPKQSHYKPHNGLSSCNCFNTT